MGNGLSTEDKYKILWNHFHGHNPLRPGNPAIPRLMVYEALKAVGITDIGTATYGVVDFQMTDEEIKKLSEMDFPVKVP